MLVSAALAFSPVDAYLGLFNFWPFFVVFVVLSELIQTTVQLRQVVRLIVFASILVAVIGLLQMVLGWLGLREIIHVRILWVVFDWVIDPQGTPPGRMSSVLTYANVLANYLVITFTLSLGFWIETFQRPQRGRRLLFITAIVLLNSIALILTNSRNAWAIAAGAALVYALYLGWRWLVIGVGLLVGTVMGAAFAPLPVRDWLRAVVPAFFWARLTDELYPNRPIATLRSTQWQFAWSLAEQRPWLGWGLRNFRPLYQAQMGIVMGHPHNLPLMLMAEVGFPATLLLLGIVGWIIFQGIQFLGGMSEVTVAEQQDAGKKPFRKNDHLLVFSVILAFLSNTVFSLFDITFFDARLNLLVWFLLAGIWGVSKGKQLDSLTSH